MNYLRKYKEEKKKISIKNYERGHVNYRKKLQKTKKNNQTMKML